MPLYRALFNLSGVAQRGELTQLTHLKLEQIAKLEQSGAVSRVSAPPLAALPDWEKRAVKLQNIGIVDVEQLVEADPAQIAKALRVKAETAVQLQRDAEQFLFVPVSDEE